jgi:hypothetical protein
LPISTLGDADAGAVHQNARRAVRRSGFGDRCFRRGGIGNVADHGDAADLGGNALGKLFIEIADGDLRALGGEPARGRGAQSRCTAGDDGGLVLQLHGVLPDGCYASSTTA